jgi:hypothetical protein
MEQWRRIRGEQEIIVRYEPDRALETLPQLLASRAERERFLALVSKLISDERILALKPTDEQIEMLGRIRGVLGLGGSPKLAAVG